MITPELLSPAGSPQKMRYAYAFGADAVYAGVPKFSLRAKENPFTTASLIEAVDYAHGLGKKIYLTANILPPNRKIESFKKSLAQLAECKPDAFIMSDPGLIQYTLQNFPWVDVHLSVQTNTINWPSAKFWYDLGVKRIILSRELSLPEISEIHEKVPGMELESFVHGAICIAYSGRCLLSNYFNHRDANQGTCTNSCRWEYDVLEAKPTDGGGCSSNSDSNASAQDGGGCSSNSNSSARAQEGNFYIEESNRPGELMPMEEDEHGTYIMNSKDLRALEYLKEMREAGVMSFKLEGRTKSEYYLSLATKTYRRAIDDLVEGREFDPTLLGELDKTSNRGFTSAFLSPNSGSKTENFDTPQETNLPQIYAGMIKETRDGNWMEVDVKNRIELGDELEYISPGDQYRFSITAMEDKNGKAIEVAHGGNGTIWMQCDGPVEPYALVSLMQKTPVEAVK
jgi:putative protease